MAKNKVACFFLGHGVEAKFVYRSNVDYSLSLFSLQRLASLLQMMQEIAGWF